MIYIVFIIFGLLPSLVWLLFYLRKDAHPESKGMVLKIFFYGMIGAIIAMLIEIWISWSIIFFIGDRIESLPILFFFLNQFIVVALVEELAKYLIVREKVLCDGEFDEPVDAMVYMIVAALGFAALENVLILFSLGSPFLVKDAALISSFRFLGATFLHALASGIIGYYLALSFCDIKKRKGLILKGIFFAVVLHGLFNISITMIERGLIDQNISLFAVSFGFLVIILSATAIFISNKFKEIKKLKSICKII